MLVQPLASDDPAEIGGYRLRARLGAGGMGRVYLASTPAGRSVALKVVRPELGDDQDFRARFRQEIQAARQVHGLYTAQLLDADPAATPPWLVTAYVPGPSLQQAVAGNGPMPEAMVFRLIAGVAEALQAIHAAGVVHRDLKPSNVLLAPDGPRVIDFGIARALEATALTRSGMMVGSPQFMAPEQIRDQPVTPAIDVFALGSLAAYAARGRPPFGEGHSAAVSYRVLHEPPDLDGCPPQLRALIEPCLRKDAAARPAPGQILEFCLAQPPGAADPGWSPPVTGAGHRPRRLRRRPSRRPSRRYPPHRPAGWLTPPQSMVNAVKLMYVGAALAAATIVTTIATTPALKAAIRQQHPFLAPGPLGAVITGTLTATVAGALISVGVWLAMARRTRRGRPGVRVMSTILFGIDCLTVARTSSHGLVTGPTWIIGAGRMGYRPGRDRVLVESAVERVFRAAAPGQVPGHSPVADGAGR